jgi:hypothetical protein
MQQEMKALHKNNTGELVELPNGKKVVGCQWVFIVKHKADGEVERYNARLVAKGFTQTYGIYYEETFPPGSKDKFYSSPTFFDSKFRFTAYSSWRVGGSGLHGTPS